MKNISYIRKTVFALLAASSLTTACNSSTPDGEEADTQAVAADSPDSTAQDAQFLSQPLVTDI